MKIVVKKSGEAPVVKEFKDFDLEDMQNLVGGFIEHLKVAETIDMWMNDCGKIYDLEPNIALMDNENQFLDVIQGDVFFAGIRPNGDTVGLTDGEITWVMNNLNFRDAMVFDENMNGCVIPAWVYNPSAS